MAREWTESFGRVPFVFGALRASAIPGPVLVRLLHDLGQSESSAKAMLHRMVSYGLLSLERRGRVGVYRLAGRVGEGFARLRDRPAAPAWDGRFHTLVYTIPETRRSLRQVFIAAAARFGYRLLRPGVLVGLADRSAGLGELLGKADVVAGWWQLDGRGSRALVASAWKLDEVAKRQRAVITALEQVRGAEQTGVQGFRRLHESTAEAYRLLADQAEIPADWLPGDWPGGRLAAALASALEALGPQVSAHADAVAAASAHAGLVERDPRWVTPPVDLRSGTD